MLCLYLKAPFAAFRPFVTGWYRPSAAFLTPSAAYGLVLNVAGVESRLDDGQSLITLQRSDLPRLRLALGALRFPIVQTIYQQLHNYPVGESGKDREAQSWGSKFNIQPVRREYLADLEGYVVVDGNERVEAAVRVGLRGGDGKRYGLPFLGDNGFLVDVLREEAELRAAHWYARVMPDAPPTEIPPSRMTIWIDRADSAGTLSALYRPTAQAHAFIPASAWTDIPPLR
jgi:CRISPR-associated protein Cas5t